MIQIKNWLTGAVIFEGEYPTIKDAVEAAVKQGVSLAYADLEGALEGADLRGADFRGADLRGASLIGANLEAPDSFRLIEIVRQMGKPHRGKP